MQNCISLSLCMVSQNLLQAVSNSTCLILCFHTFVWGISRFRRISWIAQMIQTPCLIWLAVGMLRGRVSFEIGSWIQRRKLKVETWRIASSITCVMWRHWYCDVIRKQTVPAKRMYGACSDSPEIDYKTLQRKLCGNTQEVISRSASLTYFCREVFLIGSCFRCLYVQISEDI